MWQHDLHHSDWALLASAYNSLRDNFTLADPSLSTFLTYTVNFFFHFPFDLNVYLNTLGASIEHFPANAAGFRFMLVFNGQHAGRFPPPAIRPTVESIVEFCQNLRGYAHAIPGASWPNFHEQGQQPSWSVGGKPSDFVQPIFNQDAFSIHDLYGTDDGTVSSRDMIYDADWNPLHDHWRQEALDDFFDSR